MSSVINGYDQCVICEDDILFNDGRDPWPLADEGECCEFCKDVYVTPARLKRYAKTATPKEFYNDWENRV